MKKVFLTLLVIVAPTLMSFSQDKPDEIEYKPLPSELAQLEQIEKGTMKESFDLFLTLPQGLFETEDIDAIGLYYSSFRLMEHDVNMAFYFLEEDYFGKNKEKLVAELTGLEHTLKKYKKEFKLYALKRNLNLETFLTPKTKKLISFEIDASDF